MDIRLISKETAESLIEKEIYKNVENILINEGVNEYEIYITKKRGDGEEFVRNVSSNLTKDTVFLACGGDGTVYEVLNGIRDFDKAILGVISVGSCNDFLKCLWSHFLS